MFCAEIRSFHAICIGGQRTAAAIILTSVSRSQRLPSSHLFRAQPWLSQISVPNRQRDSQRTACVACRWLDPDILERHFPQHSAISHAIQGNSASHTEFLHSGLFVSILRHLQHHFFRDHLNAPRQIHLPLSNLRLRLSRRTAKKLSKRSVCHS